MGEHFGAQDGGSACAEIIIRLRSKARDGLGFAPLLFGLEIESPRAVEGHLALIRCATVPAPDGSL